MQLFTGNSHIVHCIYIFLYVIWHLHQGYYQLSSHSFPEQPASQLNTESDITNQVPGETKFMYFSNAFCSNFDKIVVSMTWNLSNLYEMYFWISIKRDYRLEVSCGWDNRFLSNLLLKQNLGGELIMLPHQTCARLQPPRFTHFYPPFKITSVIIFHLLWSRIR